MFSFLCSLLTRASVISSVFLPLPCSLQLLGKGHKDGNNFTNLYTFPNIFFLSLQMEDCLQNCMLENLLVWGFDFRLPGYTLRSLTFVLTVFDSSAVPRLLMTYAGTGPVYLFSWMLIAVFSLEIHVLTVLCAFVI